MIVAKLLAVVEALIVAAITDSFVKDLKGNPGEETRGGSTRPEETAANYGLG